MRRFTRRGIVFMALAAIAAAVLGASIAGAGSSAVEVQPLAAMPSAGTGLVRNETPKFWFVEFPGAPLADGNSDAAVDRDGKSFRDEATSEGVSYKERLRFKALWNGVSVEANPSEIAKIRQLGSVRAIFPIETHALPPTTRISPDLATAITMTRADQAQNELGLSGKGVRVAVMDTGIDYDNPDLGGGFGPGKRVVTGTDFVGDAYDGTNTPVPDDNPDDCNGHGTHVAGIIGANGEVTGVAPGVTFGAYRVFGCKGSTTDDVMLAAMERILKDHMDVLNMSIGDAFNNWPGSPTAAGASRLVKKGVVVVASIGNNGPNGLWAAGAPGVGDRVIGVASFDNRKSTNQAFSVSPDGKLVGYDQASAAPIAPRSGTFPLARTATVDVPTADGCTALPAGSLSGKIALIRRGSCGFFVKSLNAQNAGALGVILYNSVAGRITPTVAGATPITIPVVAITAADGTLIRDRIKAGPTTMTWTTQTVTADVPTAGRISSFSSYGLAADLTLKPDIGAPGGLIWSTLPLEQGGHGSLSGTSMASPHVAGAVALLLESRSNLRRGHDRDEDDNDWRDGKDDDKNLSHASEIRDILQNSADPALWGGNPALGFLDNVQRQGAGMVDVVGAVQATSAVLPGKLSLGESENGASITKRIRIQNNGRGDVTYTLSDVAALANGPAIFAPTFFNAPAAVAFSSSTVRVEKGESRSVDVTITPNALLADKSIYGGYIVITPSTGEVLRVPYVGLKGDYQAIQILNEAIFGGSPLFLDGNLDDVAPTHAFTLVGTDQPTIAFHLDLQARTIRFLVVDAAGDVLGRGVDIDFFPRNATSSGFFALSWDGTYMPGQNSAKLKTAPDGQYQLILAAEKPLAEKNNPAHVETWTSPSFTIDRP